MKKLKAVLIIITILMICTFISCKKSCKKETNNSVTYYNAEHGEITLSKSFDTFSLTLNEIDGYEKTQYTISGEMEKQEYNDKTYQLYPNELKGTSSFGDETINYMPYLAPVITDLKIYILDDTVIIDGAVFQKEAVASPKIISLLSLNYNTNYDFIIERDASSDRIKDEIEKNLVLIQPNTISTRLYNLDFDFELDTSAPGEKTLKLTINNKAYEVSTKVLEESGQTVLNKYKIDYEKLNSKLSVNGLKKVIEKGITQDEWLEKTKFGGDLNGKYTTIDKEKVTVEGFDSSKDEMIVKFKAEVDGYTFRSNFRIRTYNDATLGREVEPKIHINGKVKAPKDTHIIQKGTEFLSKISYTLNDKTEIEKDIDLNDYLDTTKEGIYVMHYKDKYIEFDHIVVVVDKENDEFITGLSLKQVLFNESLNIDKSRLIINKQTYASNSYRVDPNDLEFEILSSYGNDEHIKVTYHTTLFGKQFDYIIYEYVFREFS